MTPHLNTVNDVVYDYPEVTIMSAKQTNTCIATNENPAYGTSTLVKITDSIATAENPAYAATSTVAPDK